MTSPWWSILLRVVNSRSLLCLQLNPHRRLMLTSTYMQYFFNESWNPVYLYSRSVAYRNYRGRRKGQRCKQKSTATRPNCCKTCFHRMRDCRRSTSGTASHLTPHGRGWSSASDQGASSQVSSLHDVVQAVRRHGVEKTHPRWFEFGPALCGWAGVGKESVGQ